GRPLVATWTLTIRANARVERRRFDTLERALAELEARVDELAGRAKENPAGTRLRQYGPEQQVVARIELAGPERRLAGTRAGIDVHGDGSTEAYLGRVRRQTVDASKGEPAVKALRRVLQDR
ncbi:MAG TPA: hypothetical protein VJ741_07145, partial [Solirubrobacteraceae bacterium]|nr:hypothetical protein [Solirubrobacteraceae bacterium]